MLFFEYKIYIVPFCQKFMAPEEEITYDSSKKEILEYVGGKLGEFFGGIGLRNSSRRDKGYNLLELEDVLRLNANGVDVLRVNGLLGRGKKGIYGTRRVMGFVKSALSSNGSSRGDSLNNSRGTSHDGDLPGKRRGKDSFGIYLSEILNKDPLSIEEERRLMNEVRDGDTDARAKIIESNLRFVVHIAREYQGRGFPLEDLVGYGNQGLVKAVERFDESHSVKLISYAVFWIRQSILQAIYDESRLVRLPVNKSKLIRKIFGEDAKLLKTDENLLLSWRVDYISKLLEIPRYEVEEAMEFSAHPISLDEKIKDEDGGTTRDILPDIFQPETDEESLRSSMNETVLVALGELDKMEAEVISLYFGIGQERGTGMTLKQIGSRHGFTKEWIRQIRDKALEKLKKNQSLRELWTGEQNHFRYLSEEQRNFVSEK